MVEKSKIEKNFTCQLTEKTVKTVRNSIRENTHKERDKQEKSRIFTSTTGWALNKIRTYKMVNLSNIRDKIHHHIKKFINSYCKRVTRISIYMRLCDNWVVYVIMNQLWLGKRSRARYLDSYAPLLASS